MNRLSADQHKLVERIFALNKSFPSAEIVGLGGENFYQIRVCDYSRSFAFWLAVRELCYEGQAHGFSLSPIAQFSEFRLAFVTIDQAAIALRSPAQAAHRESRGLPNLQTMPVAPRLIPIEG